jgi:uncharacterized membrane protein YgdD (TMEM256/DUF423 family)
MIELPADRPFTAIGAATPLGGLAFLAGWACLAWSALAA